MKVNWAEIKEGAKGFEKLATTYIQELDKNIKWKQTSQTHDGNKDAVAIIFGYKAKINQSEEWWMEAKYSTEKKILTRYRLDATIVSAILSGKVTRVVFVSNILINPKTIMDIQLALQKSTECRNVDFYTKYELEYWLSKNPLLYEKYFNVNDTSNIQLDIPEMFVIQGIDYFSESSKCFSFKESLKELYIGSTYFAYFSLFSPENTSLIIKPAKGITGIKILENRELKIKQGENTLYFRFKIKENYKNTRKTKPILSFILDKIEITGNYAIVPKINTQKDVKLPIQNELLKKINYEFEQFKHSNKTAFHFLCGKSGVGKSYIIDKFICQYNWNTEDIFYLSFSEAKLNNYEKLLQVVLFILFPYLSPNSIDADYLYNINKTHPYVSTKLITLIEQYKHLEELAVLFSCYDINSNIFPSNIKINRRIIIVEDLHKLDNVGLKFFVSICTEINEKDFPVFMLGATQPALLLNPYYNVLKERCVFSIWECQISIQDILFWLEKHTASTLIIKEDDIFTTNIIEMFIFARYLIDENIKIKNIQDLILCYKIFQRSNIMEYHVLQQFKNCFLTDNSIKSVCEQIYWNAQAFPYNEKYENQINKLLYSELIKFDSDGNLIPYHDIYIQHYRNHFAISDMSWLMQNPDSPETLQYMINHEINPHKTDKVIKKILQLLDDKQFHTVLYILEDMFENNEKSILKNKFGKEKFYKLYLAYALAAHQQTVKFSCELIFKEIYENTIMEYNAEILNCGMISLWEMLVIEFESMNYSYIEKMSLEIEEIIARILRLKGEQSSIKKNIYYQRTQGQKMLVLSDKGKDIPLSEYTSVMKGMKENGFPYLCESFTARYAVTLMVSNPQKGIQLLEIGQKNILKKYGEQDKHYLWCGFYYHFYNLIYNDNYSSLTQMIKFHNEMKLNQYGNYRKKLYAIACYFYSKKDYVNGNKYLFHDTLFTFELRSRYQAFFEIASALHECINGNFEFAISSLEKAADILKKHPSYISIPLHNLKLIKCNNFDCNKIKFWFGEAMLSDTFYIDSRSAW